MRTKSLKIGANIYPVKKITSNKYYGVTTHPSPEDAPKIEISSRGTSHEQALTLLHEAIHAITVEYGIRYYFKSVDADEALVRMLETAIAQLFIENKTFSRELLGAMSKRN